MNQERAQDVPRKRLQLRRVPPRSHLDSAVALYYDIYKYHISDYYVNPQERKPQAQRDWLDLLQGRAHNVHEVDVCALSLLISHQLRSGSVRHEAHEMGSRNGAVLPCG